MRRINLVLRICYVLLCLALLVVHLSYRSDRYFRFQTETKFALYTPIEHKLCKISLCFNLNTLLSKDFKRSFFDSEEPVIINKTAQFLFNSAPKADQLLRRCEYRDFNLDILWKITGRECSKVLNIQRYRMGVYMCYKLDLNMTDEFDFYRLTHSLFDSSRLFRLELNVPFEKGHALLAIAHFENHPHEERIFNQEIVQSLTKLQKFDLYYDLFEFYRLSRPYEPSCNHRNIHACFFECERVLSGRQNLSAEGGLTLDGKFNNETRIVNLEKFNKTMFFNTEVKCYKLCINSLLCEEKMVFTFISNRFADQVSSVNIDTAKYPITKIIYQAKYPMEFFLTETFSLAAIWLGFSIYACLIKLNQFGGKRSGLAQQFKRSVQLLLELKKHLAFGLSVAHRRSNLNKSHRSKSKRVIRRRFKIISFVFVALTTSMLIFQLTNVSRKYFAYETQLKIKYETNPKLFVPSLAICVDLADHFNISVDPFDDDTDEVMDRFSGLDLRLDNLFKQFASDDQFLFNCRVRQFDDIYWPMKLLNSSQCSEEFYVTRFYSDLQMCHSINPKSEVLQSWFRVTHMKLTLLNQGTIYSVVPHPRLKNYIHLELILYFGDFPTLSKEFGSGSYRTLDPRLELLSYQTTEYTTLPAPYDTKCFDETVEIADCYMEAVKKINRLPYGGLHTVPLPHRLLTYSDLKNESINRYWINLENKCAALNKIQRCSGSYTQTYISHPLDRTDFEIEFAVQSTTYPVVIRRSVARMTFYEFYYQTLCCLNFWLGFTFIALNPVDHLVKNSSAKIKSLIHRQIPRINSRLRRLHRLLIDTSKGKKGPLWLIRNVKTTPLIKNVVSIFICLTGCCIFLKFKVTEYLNYPILIESERKFEQKTNYSMTICIDTLYKVQLNQSDLNNFYFQASKYLSVSIGEIFKRTPEPSDLIVYCRLYGRKDNRKFNDLTKVSDRLLLIYRKKSDCLDQLEMRKFVMQSKVCYTYKPKKQLKWNRHQMINTFNGPKFLFMLAFKSSMLTRRYNLIINDGNDLPELSFMWSSKVVNVHQNVWHAATYTKFKQKILLPPFSDDGFRHALHMSCIGRCINGQISVANLSFSTMFDKPSHFRYITLEDRSNSFANRIVQNASTFCSKSCSRNHQSTKTRFEFASTFVTNGKTALNANWSEYRGNLIRIYVRSTDLPVFIQIFKRKYSLFELFIAIGSVIGIWSGISVIDLNPFKRRPKLPPEEELNDLKVFLAKLKLRSNLRLRIVQGHPLRRRSEASRFRAVQATRSF